MHTDRRQFIKMAGVGLVGVGMEPIWEPIGRFWRDPGSSPFPRATPESQGVSSQAIRDFLAAAHEATTSSGTSWHSFMLLRHGHVVAEGWWNPFEASFVHSLYSLSKSFTSTAIGLLVKEGKLDIHAPLTRFFPHDLPDSISDHPDGHLQEVTVRHLLTMNTGHDADTMPAMSGGVAGESWVKTYLAQPVPFTPGTHFLYNTGNTYMLGAILYAVTGQTLEEYLGPRLFQPLGIVGYDWEKSPQGLNTAGYGLRIKTEDIARLGQLYLQKGQWEGSTILPAAWVEEATSYQTSSQTENADWSQGYGYQFWRCTHNAFRGDGAYGQYCIMMPEQDAVLAVTSQTADMQKSLNIIWDHLLPGIRDGVLPEDPAGYAALKRELGALSLPVAGRQSPGGTLDNKKSWDGSEGQAKRTDGKKEMVAKTVMKKGGVWTMAENTMGIKTMAFHLSEKGGRLTVTTADHLTKTLRFGWERWGTGTERELYVFKFGNMFPMPTRIAGTATWIDNHTLQINLRMVEAIFGDRISFVFDEDRLSVSFVNSVAETALVKTEDPRKGLEGKL